MKLITPTEFKANLDRFLDEVLKTGEPLEIKMGDQKLRIAPVKKVDKFRNLISRPDVIQGDPEDLGCGWEY